MGLAKTTRLRPTGGLLKASAMISPMGSREGSRFTAEDKRFLKISAPVAAFIGGLCCFVPVVTVLFGLGSVSYAIALTDLLYYDYGWAFRLAGLGFLLSALAVYFYQNEGVCSIEDTKRNRRKIINLTAATIGLGAILYVVWLYVIVELIGIGLGIW